MPPHVAPIPPCRPRMTKPKSTLLQFLRSRFSIEDNSLWRVLGLLKPYRRRVVMANIPLAFASTLGGLALVSLHPLFSATFKFVEADRAQTESAEVRSEAALAPTTGEADIMATAEQTVASAEAQGLPGGEAGFGSANARKSCLPARLSAIPRCSSRTSPRPDSIPRRRPNFSVSWPTSVTAISRSFTSRRSAHTSRNSIASSG